MLQAVFNHNALVCSWNKPDHNAGGLNQFVQGCLLVTMSAVPDLFKAYPL